MVDKRRERLYVEHLSKVYPRFPAGVIEDGEPPDFLVRASDGRLIGIEVTVFHLPPAVGERPYQEVQSLKNRVVRLAWIAHTERGGPPLYVRVFLNRPSELTKQNVYTIAGQLAEAIGRARVPTTFGEPGASLQSDGLPSAIGHVSIDAAIRTPSWSADAGGWVAPVDALHVGAVLDRKCGMSRLSRTKCDELWLTIVCDNFGKAAQAEISEEARTHQYAHPFDRVIWFEIPGGAYELGRREDQA